MIIELRELVEEEIRKHAESTYPYECCGFLFGLDNGKREVTLAVPATNSKKENKRRRFSIESEEYLFAERLALEKNLQLLGIYHSHPDHPADPSEHDRVKAMPFFSYVIVSVEKGESKEIKSWLLNENFEFDNQEVSMNYNITKI